MFDHIKAAAMTVAGIVRGLFLTVSPHAWRYRYRDALYEVRNGDNWSEYQLYEDDFEPHGARTSDEVLKPDANNVDDLVKEINEAIEGLKLEDLPVATAAVKEHKSHFMFHPRQEGPDGERFNAMQD